MNSDNIIDLEQRTKELRRTIVQMIGPNVGGHYGGSMSIADVLAALYFYKMKHDPKNPQLETRDRFIMSKGHCGLAQYAALALCDYFPLEELSTLKQLGSRLQGHPIYEKLPGIEATTGSLGQGLSIACGIAASLKLDNNLATVYCVLGDAEVNEGQIWEAAQSAYVHKLDNIVCVLDCNKLSASFVIKQEFDIGEHEAKWESFGFNVISIDGHNMTEVVDALDNASIPNGKPTIIVAHTIKGKSLSFAEGNTAFHHAPISDEQYAIAMELLKD